ncbi:MAG: hypothetical protein IJW54_04215 [Clostridia bacterium]|nr:hypothetical protein [Clostridia bacterium]
MKHFKKLLAILLVLLTFFSLFSCSGEYHEGTKPGQDSSGGSGNTGGSGNEGGGDEFVPPTMNDDPADDFTVTLMADGVSYKPRMDMYAYWNDGFSVHTAKFDENGIARIDGLDGDYRVTLSAVPNEYAYDPNNNYATNDDKNIVVNLYTLNYMSDGGAGIYDCKSFRYTGVYSAVIDGPDDAIYFEYAPSEMGTYTIESWMDVTADNINPYIDVYGGHSEFKYYIGQTNDGGAMGSYTINFVHTVQIASENISAGGQATYTFAIRADVKNNKYPVTIMFAVKRDGDFELQRPSTGGTAKGTKIPEHDFSDFNVSDHEYDDSYSLVNPEYQLKEGSTTYVFNESKFKLWSKDEGGDDFYHVYDKEKYSETGGYGPILYGYITKPTRFIDIAFNRIEYNSSGEVINAALSAGGYNYKHFIEGYTALATFGNINGGSYYCDAECPCHDSSVSNENWACTASCTQCLANCRRCPEELIGFEGYQAYANSDGLVPVTKELRDFFQNYCTKEIFFYDGTGRFEREPFNGKYFQSVGESGWLFACAYYEK